MAEKMLITCYSYTGNTYKIAEEIKKQTGAPLCELYPKQPYSMDFETALRQVRWEVKRNFKPSIFPINQDVDKYSTIFIGTPNWCGTIAPPLATFLTKYDMADKVLQPFLSHCGGGKGNIKNDIEELCPTAMVKEPCYIINDGGIFLPEKISQLFI